jgi:cytochrome c oxidase subunit 2
MFGRTTKLRNGATISADDVYVRESILNPSAKIVEGFDDVMPVPELTEKEVDEIMEYLKTLK